MRKEKTLNKLVEQVRTQNYDLTTNKGRKAFFAGANLTDAQRKAVGAICTEFDEAMENKKFYKGLSEKKQAMIDEGM